MKKNKRKAYTVKLFGDEVPALNSEDAIPTQCTWHCHTKGCSHRDQNVISCGPINTLRQKIIDSLGVSNGDKYKSNNILFLVILWPVLMFGLVVANVELFIRRTKKPWRNWLLICMFIARISASPTLIYSALPMKISVPLSFASCGPWLPWGFHWL